LFLVGALLALIALLKGGAHGGQALWLYGTAEAIGQSLRLRLYRHLLRLPLAHHRQQALGDLLTRMLDDVQRLQEVVLLAPITLVRESLGALALLAVALWMAPGLALLAAIALPLVALVIGLFSRGIKRAAARRQEQLSVLADRAAQGLQAIREVKSHGAEEQELEGFSRHGHNLVQWSLRGIALQACAPLINELMAALALGLVLVYAGSAIASGGLAAPRFISFFSAVLLMYRPLKDLGKAYHALKAGQASIQRVAELLALPVEPLAHDRALCPLTERLELKHLSFAYGSSAKGEHLVLQDFALQLPLGKIVALCGASGAGKSTVAHLVCGLEQPLSGSYVWDGLEIEASSYALLRAQVAFVPQQPLWLHASIAHNLRYGNPWAREQELAQALDRVGLSDVIARLPRGHHTLLGPGGLDLSVGELQRLALARALLRPVKVIVLDEPSAALDAKNTSQLLQTLQELRPQRAILLITHSLEVRAIADEVITLGPQRELKE
jgi:subfamily B ATP-binding cassette protein MsbA